MIYLPIATISAFFAGHAAGAAWKNTGAAPMGFINPIPHNVSHNLQKPWSRG